MTTVGGLTACLALAGPLAATAWSAPPAAGWTSVELGTLGGARTDARDVNEKGQVVGQSQTADGRWHAFLWQDGVMTDLTPDARQGMAVAINDRGEIAGFGLSEDGTSTQALRWYRGVRSVLAEEGIAQEINERGQVAGYQDHPEMWASTPFVWTAGTLVDVGPVPVPETFPSSSALDLNRSGAVLGVTETHWDHDVTYVWRDGVFEILGDGTAPVRGTDLSDRGHVVGHTWDEVPRQVATLWRDGEVQHLGTLPGDASSEAAALNEHDVVVGWSQGATPDQTGRQAILWDGELQSLDVVDDGWSEATEVNDGGQVAGRLGYVRADGTPVQRVFVWADGTATRLGGEHEGIAVTDQTARGHVLVDQYDGADVRAVLHVPPKRRS
ncbi:hypothetical protein [Cellulomonas cellasea]|uniref:Putative HAF family extracellular repeat protein n=1 Tax=Cellulomonas cellasea TaxID=43670 RepID=A0A7W4YB01_9CELL|nr:hypothetical protein [Cellulomonas cellasea]MBB2923123.1 putative HAF family extracellular repeat protein [Cellulomonas cellasea]